MNTARDIFAVIGALAVLGTAATILFLIGSDHRKGGHR